MLPAIRADENLPAVTGEPGIFYRCSAQGGNARCVLKTTECIDYPRRIRECVYMRIIYHDFCAVRCNPVTAKFANDGLFAAGLLAPGNINIGFLEELCSYLKKFQW